MHFLEESRGSLLHLNNVSAMTAKVTCSPIAMPADVCLARAVGLGKATFDDITTRADSAVGVQISKPVGQLVVRRR